MGLFPKKVNNSKLIKPMGFELVFEDGMITFSRQDVRDTALEEHMSLKDRIQNILRNRQGGLSVAQIAELLDKTESHIRKEISEGHRNLDLFTKLHNGNWANRSQETEEGVKTWI